MPLVAPRHVYLNAIPIQVRNWQWDDEHISFRVTFRGSRAAEEFQKLADSDITISWDDVPEYTGRAIVTDSRVTGDGPTAVHLLRVQLSPPPPAITTPDESLSLEEQVATLRQELAALRHEVAQLRAAVIGRQAPAGGSGGAPLAPGIRTLIEEDIDTDSL